MALAASPRAALQASRALLAELQARREDRLARLVGLQAHQAAQLVPLAPPVPRREPEEVQGLAEL